MKNRQQFIQLIHIAKSQLGLDDATYRAMLAGLELPDSTTRMSIPQLGKVLEHLKSKGFKVRSKPKDRAQADDAQSKMIRGLWLELHALGYVNDPSETALAAWIKRETDVDALQWLTGPQVQTTIEKLKQWRRRDERKLQKLASVLCAQGRVPSSNLSHLARLWFDKKTITKAVAQQLLDRLHQEVK